MRQDLAKCTTERPRHGRSWAITKKCGGSVRVNPYRDFDYPEEYGGFRSSSRNRQINAKDFSDFLSPLRGAIRKNIGRPWGKVFGEFCEALDRRGLSGYHIWTHLMWEVETNTFLGEDGQVYERPAFGGSPSKVDGFYVHPLTGLLLYKEPWRFRRLASAKALRNCLSAFLIVWFRSSNTLRSLGFFLVCCAGITLPLFSFGGLVTNSGRGIAGTSLPALFLAQ